MVMVSVVEGEVWPLEAKVPADTPRWSLQYGGSTASVVVGRRTLVADAGRFSGHDRLSRTNLAILA